MYQELRVAYWNNPQLYSVASKVVKSKVQQKEAFCIEVSSQITDKLGTRSQEQYASL
jgi:hypothetical protein